MPIQYRLDGSFDFTGPRRRPEDRPAWRRPRLGQRVVFVPTTGEVAQRRDYDLPQRVAPAYSEVDPPPQLERRESRPLSDWLKRHRAGA